MGQFPTWGAQVPPLRARNYRFSALGLSDGTKDLERDKSFLTPTVYLTDEKMRQMVAGTGATFLSPLTTLCNDQGCLLVVPDSDGKPIYWDDNHFTRTGSVYFIKQNRAAFLGT